MTAGADQTARLWDAQTGQELREFVGHTYIVTTAAFSPNGQLVVTGSPDRTIHFSDVDRLPLMQAACSHVLRDLTADERRQFDILDFGPVC